MDVGVGLRVGHADHLHVPVLGVQDANLHEFEIRVGRAAGEPGFRECVEQVLLQSHVLVDAGLPGNRDIVIVVRVAVRDVDVAVGLQARAELGLLRDEEVQHHVRLERFVLRRERVRVQAAVGMAVRQHAEAHVLDQFPESLVRVGR